MKIKKLFLVSMTLIILMSFQKSFSEDLTIVTGNREGTYFQIAEDIKKYAEKFGMTIRNIATEGSLDNINHIYRTKNVQLGIVQADALYSILDHKKDDPDLQEYAKKLRFIFPLYYNEVHILAHENIRTFEDLKDKRIAVGSRNSGTFLTSAYLFELSGIKPGGQYFIAGREAIEKLRNKEIDAMIYVAGQPIPLFEKEIKPEDKLHFVPIAPDKFKSLYDSAYIKKSSYKWLSKDVQTLSIKSLLMTYDFKGENCQHIQKIAKIISNNLDCLREDGHEKWKNVDLYASNLKRWPKYECIDRKKFDEEPTYKASSCKTVNKVREKVNCSATKNAVSEALCNMKKQKEKENPE